MTATIIISVDPAKNMADDKIIEWFLTIPTPPFQIISAKINKP